MKKFQKLALVKNDATKRLHLGIRRVRGFSVGNLRVTGGSEWRMVKMRVLAIKYVNNTQCDYSTSKDITIYKMW